MATPDLHLIATGPAIAEGTLGPNAYTTGRVAQETAGR